MSVDTYDRLVRAGAPTLPVGFFYRVVARHSLFVSVKVEIRERFRALGVIPWSRKISSYELFLEKDEERTALEVAAYCCRGATQAANRKLEESRFDREMRGLTGDHP